MKKGTAVVLIAVALLVGFVVGREFPTHHYVEFQRLTDDFGRGLLFDAATGKVCDPLETPRAGYRLPYCPSR